VIKGTNVFRLYFIVCIIIVFIMVYLIQIANEIKDFDLIILLSFLIIGVLSLYNIFTSFKNKYNLYKIHGYFFLIFMFLAPLYQYATDAFSWGFKIDENLIIYTNLIIIVWLIIYLVLYRLTKAECKEGLSLPVNKTFIIIGFFTIIFTSLFFLAYVGGVNNLFYRTIEGISLDESNNMIITKSLRPLPVLFLAYIYLLIKKNKVDVPYLKGIFIILLVSALLINFPTGVARYHTAAVYIGLAVLFYKRINFDLVFLFGIIFAFPILETIRNSSGNLLEDLSWQTINFASGNFDAYSMLMRTVYYVTIDGPTYGMQLLGVLLFFIPRSLWHTKPVGSGSFVGEELGLTFLNISSPLPAEAIVNFGFVFYLVIAIFLGYITKKLDTLYWKKSDNIRYIDIYYIFLLGLFFFILRGDLLSTYAFTVAFFFPLGLTYIFQKIK
jgi:oligosaccharide repeat unit polymerase